MPKAKTWNTASKARFETIRWPNGPICPHCRSQHAQRLDDGGGDWSYQCLECFEAYNVLTNCALSIKRIHLSYWCVAITKFRNGTASVRALAGEFPGWGKGKSMSTRTAAQMLQTIRECEARGSYDKEPTKV